ncbi:MAG: hypothetical protein GY705_23165 [Bacteroidetes bacterium]|nr:hypothetical protein [Bacteroidota bacterium]
MKEEKKRTSPAIIAILCILHSGLKLSPMWADKEIFGFFDICSLFWIGWIS